MSEIKRFLLAVVMLLLIPAACQASEDSNAWAVNHVMANKIDFVQGQGFMVNGPAHIRFVNPAGAAQSLSQFSTLDQVIFLRGTYKIDIRIVDDATGTVAAQANHNTVTIKDDRTIQGFVTDWSLKAGAGLYTYQLIVGNSVIASFKIDIANAQ